MSNSSTAEDTVTVLYSDSGRGKVPRETAPTPYVGYVILAPIAPEILPSIGTSNFLGHYPHVYRETPDRIFVLDPAPAVDTVISTVTAGSMTPGDKAFLGSPGVSFPVSIERLAASKGGVGNQSWDLVAYFSSLRQLERMPDRGSTILVRTDGELPEWIDGRKRVTVEVDGRNVAPEMLDVIRDAEKRLGGVIHETVQRNFADEQINYVKRQARAHARRADAFQIA